MILKKMVGKLVGTVVVVSLGLGGLTNVVNAYTDIKDSEEVTVKQSTSPQYYSDIYELSNGATLVINDKKHFYELFIDKFLCDWSYELDSKEELLKYNSMYSVMKDEYKKYNNEKVRVKRYTAKKGIKTFYLSNGIKVVKKNKKEVDVYLPIMGNLPYKTNESDAKKIVDTYIEFVNDLK